MNVMIVIGVPGLYISRDADTIDPFIINQQRPAYSLNELNFDMMSDELMGIMMDKIDELKGKGAIAGHHVIRMIMVRSDQTRGNVTKHFIAQHGQPVEPSTLFSMITHAPTTQIPNPPAPNNVVFYLILGEPSGGKSRRKRKAKKSRRVRKANFYKN